MKNSNDNPLLLDEVTSRFVSAHRHDDVKALALHTPRGVDREAAIRQVAGWQAMSRKVPQWAATDGIVYPPHLSLEQCSSQATATLKASLVEGDTLVDLTGGLGVDCSFMARSFKRVTYVERDANLCELARHNFALLGLDHVTVVNVEAERFLAAMEGEVGVIFIDPARRDAHGGRVVLLSDCTPNVEALRESLLAHARRVLIKLSPMLDSHDAVRRMEHVSRVLVVSVGGECKELLLMLERGFAGSTTVSCINDDTTFDYCPDDPCPPLPLWDEQNARRFLYEPNASIMKAGAFAPLAARFSLEGVAMNSHLFLSDTMKNDFPGRTFVIDEVMPLSSSLLKRGLPGLKAANVTVRNYPMRTEQLRRRLRLNDGGDTYLFATTGESGRKWLFSCHKP